MSELNMPEFMLAKGGDLQVYLYFGFLLLFILVERLAPKRAPSQPQGQRLRTNASLTLAAILLLPILPMSLISAAMWAESQGIGLMNMLGQQWPVPVVVVITLLLRGFISFATHFLNHKIPLLWRLHRVHHLDTELDVSSTVRFHPLEMPVSMMVSLPMIVLLGLSPWILFLYELFDVVITLFSHSNLRLPRGLDRLLRYVIVTPNLHTVHHSSYEPETNSNYSAVFPIWDIVFGTFRTHTKKPLEDMQLGLEEVRDANAQNFWWLVASPFRNFKRTSSSQRAQSPG